MKLLFTILFLLSLFPFTISSQVIRIRKKTRPKVQQQALHFTTFQKTGNEVIESIDNNFAILLDSVNQYNLIAHQNQPSKYVEISQKMKSISYDSLKTASNQSSSFRLRKINLKRGIVHDEFSLRNLKELNKTDDALIPIKQFYICVQKQAPYYVYFDIYEKYNQDSIFLGKIRLKSKVFKKPKLNYKYAREEKRYNPFIFRSRQYKYLKTQKNFLLEVSKDNGKRFLRSGLEQHENQSLIWPRMVVDRYNVRIKDKNRKTIYREKCIGNLLSDELIEFIQNDKKKHAIRFYKIYSVDNTKFSSYSLHLK